MTIKMKSKIKISDFKTTATFSIEKGLLAFFKNKFYDYGEFSLFVYNSLITNNKKLIKEYNELTEEEKIKIMNKYYNKE